MKVICTALPLLAFGAGAISLGFPGAGAPDRAQTTKKTVDYAAVDLIFRRYDCVFCHFDGPQAFAKFNLTDYNGLMSGGKDGQVIKPGDSEGSVLVRMVSGEQAPHMPPQGSAMKSEEVATIKAWVEAGASTSEYGKALSQYFGALKVSDFNTALSACDEIEGMRIPNIPTADIAATCRLPIYLKNGNESGWTAAATRIVNNKDLRSGFLNEIAWRIVDPKSTLKHKDADLGLKAAELGVEGTGRKAAGYLDTLAWAYYLKGDKAKALATEKEAVLCKDAANYQPGLDETVKTFGG